jgi:hypothetical protein
VIAPARLEGEVSLENDPHEYLLSSGVSTLLAVEEVMDEPSPSSVASRRRVR